MVEKKKILYEQPPLEIGAEEGGIEISFENTWFESRSKTLIIERTRSKSSSDNHSYLDYLGTPLSCIAQPVSDIGKITVKFPFARMTTVTKKIYQVLLKPEMKIKKRSQKYCLS